MSTVNATDNETDPRCVFRCCDCQNRMFSSDHVREMQICPAKCRKREKEREDKLKRGAGRERNRSESPGEKDASTFGGLSLLIAGEKPVFDKARMHSLS